MKKIFALIMVLVISLSFISCSDSGSSSSLTDQEKMAILSAAFTGSSAGIAAANPTKAVSTDTSIDGISVTGDFSTINSGDYTMTITFNNYSDSNVTLNGSITFSLAGGTTYSMTGSITAVYQGESYSFGMNITGTGSDSMTGTITVDGTVYNL